MGKNRLILYLNTIKHITLRQLFYQIYYRLNNIKRRKIDHNNLKIELKIKPFIPKRNTLEVEGNHYNFTFLNMSKSFESKEIQYDFIEYGLLWSYNLNYFDYILQDNITDNMGLDLIETFYTKDLVSVSLEPYPLSLRIFNIVKFLSKNSINNNFINNNLLSDLDLLNRKIEYHLKANHVLENAFALFLGSYYYKNVKILKKARELLKKELKIQVLKDGMHYERSAMYHLIILERLLDTINIIKNNDYDVILDFLIENSIKMIAYAKNWEDLERIPMMQDSTYEIALPLSDLLNYSKEILEDQFPRYVSNPLDSNYRFFNHGLMKFVINIGEISPSYQPGHSHADELNFEMFFNGKPIIVDKGISTYEKNHKRFLERSTQSHNCISVNHQNSSEVWGGFRVGKRSNVIVEETKNIIKAKLINSQYCFKRKWIKSSDVIEIEDKVVMKNSSFSSAIGYLHLHPRVKIKFISAYKVMLNETILVYSEHSPLLLGKFHYSLGFNKTQESNQLSYSLNKEKPFNKLHVKILNQEHKNE